MRRSRLLPAMLIAAMPACSRADDQASAPGMVMPSEAQALGDAAAMIDTPRGRAAVAAPQPVLSPPAPR